MRAGVWVCWAKHVAEADGGYQLRIESALNDALRDEFGVIPSEVASWVVNSLAIESAHLNSALLGVVTLTIPEADLANRLARTLKYHSAVEGFLSKHELLDRVQSDFGKGFWHALDFSDLPWPRRNSRKRSLRQ